MDNFWADNPLGTMEKFHSGQWGINRSPRLGGQTFLSACYHRKTQYQDKLETRQKWKNSYFR